MFKLIGHGTHGKIYLKNESIVIKEFANRPMKQNCICNLGLACNYIHYEYIIQEQVYKAINTISTQIKIKIPKPKQFSLNNDNTLCHYEMDYIHPCRLDDNDKHLITQINMYSPEMDEIYEGVGHFLGYQKLDLSKCNISSIEELAYQIGTLFSYLHYVLHIDGYDCELVLGHLSESNKSDIFLIDFDKASYFEFKLGYIARRKIDESIIEEKVFTSEKKIAWFLFSAMTGMGLLPHNENLKRFFMNGYARYLDMDSVDKIVLDVYNEILEFVRNYSSTF